VFLKTDLWSLTERMRCRQIPRRSEIGQFGEAPREEPRAWTAGGAILGQGLGVWQGGCFGDADEVDGLDDEKEGGRPLPGFSASADSKGL
jgi:hypothetical protein